MISEEKERAEVAVSGGRMKYKRPEELFSSGRVEACCGAGNSTDFGDGSLDSGKYWASK